MLQNFWDKLCQVSREANVLGINVPMVKDPKTGTGSVSLTLVFISSSLVIAGLVVQWSGYTMDIDRALEFFYASSALYFGRKWTGKTKSAEKTPPPPGE